MVTQISAKRESSCRVKDLLEKILIRLSRPFTMTLQSLKITDSHSDVAWYAYGDQSGSFDSIKAIPGKSNAHKAINEKTFAQHTEQQWEGLSKGAKIGIAAGLLGLFAVLFAVFILYCIKQRRRGKAEKAIADREWEAQFAEFQHYRDKMRKGGFAVSSMGHVSRCCVCRLS